MAKNEYPLYTPMPSLGHELALMFGFLALCAVAMAAYVALWRVSQTRLHAQDLAHRKSINKTPHSPGTTPTTAPSPSTPDKNNNTTLHEKMLDRFAVPADRAELPVHGIEMYARGRGVYALENGNASAPRISSSLARRGMSPVSPLGSSAVSPRGGIGLDSIVGVALGPGGSGSPARRVGGAFNVVEIGTAASRD